MRKMFPGGITPQGFHSFYNYILEPSPQKRFILKGAPGTGKSTLMQKLGRKAQEKGWECEYHYCSSDPDSLDGVAFPDWQMAVLDGTSPHNQEAEFPGAVDEIINLGQCWDTWQLEQQAAAIQKLSREKTLLFQKAIAYLNLTGGFYAQERAFYREAQLLDLAKLNRLAERLERDYFFQTSGMARLRKMFGGVLTYRGFVNHLPSLMDDLKQRVILTGDRGTGKSLVLNRLLEAALKRGVRVEACYSIWEPDQPDHLLIPEWSLGFITSTPEHFYAPKPGDQVWDLNDFLLGTPFQSGRKLERELGRQTLALAVDFLGRARAKHLLLEEIYSKAMDFAQLEQKTGEIWEKIEAKVG